MAKQSPFDTPIGGSTEGISGFVYAGGISVFQCSWFITSIPSKCKEWLCGKNGHVLSMFWISRLGKFSPLSYYSLHLEQCTECG